MAQYEHLGDDLASMFPEQTRNPLRIFIWSILLIADLAAGAAAAFALGLSPENGELAGILFLAVMAGASAGLFWVENALWKLFRNLFR